MRELWHDSAVETDSVITAPRVHHGHSAKTRVRGTLTRYGAAVLLTLLVLPVGLLLQPLLAHDAPLLLFIIPVVLSAAYGGFGPGLLAIVVSVLLGTYFLLPPIASFSLAERSTRVMLTLFVLRGLIFSTLGALLHVRAVALRTTIARLQTSEARARVLVDSVKDYAIFMLDRDGHIISWNTGAQRIKGYRADQILGQHVSCFYPPDEVAQGKPAHGLHRAAADGRYEDEGWRVRQDGTCFWAHVTMTPIHDDRGVLQGFAKVTHDRTAHKQAAAQLQHQALHDALTGLPNRTLLLDRLAHAVAYVQRHPSYQFAVLFLDLDRFKTVNDSLGHDAGDHLLIAVAERLQTTLRPQDTLARLGGDEFVILLDDLGNVTDATQVAQRIQQVLALPFHLHGHEVVMRTSIGITLNTPSAAQPEDLLREADTALYQAKALGTGQYALFDTAMHAHALRRLQLEAELRRAIAREELVLHYQPIVSLATGNIAEVEALVRWQHPEHGLLFPNQFIPVAEDTGLIGPLSDWVMHTACAQTNAWQAAGASALRVAVNLSPRQFCQPDLPSKIAALVADTGLAPQYLQLELTESSVMEHTAQALTLLEALRAHGIRLALDDFGTGYSSLSYLKHLPLTTVKLDRSFVQEITTNPADAAIATATIALAHSLNMHVTAEGVETEAQLRFFQDQQADAVQGYVCGHPMPADQLTHHLHARWWGAPTVQEPPPSVGHVTTCPTARGEGRADGAHADSSFTRRAW
jgi:diguanylate cyclase (GGDEF)-like protein/PAS domain S-box-containing protein